VLPCLFQPPGRVEKWSGARAWDMANRISKDGVKVIPAALFVVIW
jgi:hypothetical protein